MKTLKQHTADGEARAIILHGKEYSLCFQDAKRAFERQFIEAALKWHRGNITKTAASIRMERRNLQVKIKKLEIDPDRMRNGTQPESPQPTRRDIEGAIAILRALASDVLIANPRVR